MRRIGDEWRLTQVGEAVLRANPPEELPDFSIFEDVIAEDESAEEEYGSIRIEVIKGDVRKELKF